MKGKPVVLYSDALLLLCIFSLSLLHFRSRPFLVGSWLWGSFPASWCCHRFDYGLLCSELCSEFFYRNAVFTKSQLWPLMDSNTEN